MDFEARALRLARAAEILSPRAELKCSPNSAPERAAVRREGRVGVGLGEPQLSHQKSVCRTGVMEAHPDSVHVAAQHLISVTARNTLPRRATSPPLPTCGGRGEMQMASPVVPDLAQHGLQQTLQRTEVQHLEHKHAGNLGVPGAAGS